MSSRVSTYDNFWSSPVAFVGSLCVHAVLAWLIITNMGSCGRQGDFGAAEEFRNVGVYVVDDTVRESEQPDATETTEAERPELPADLNQELTEQTPAQPQMPEINSLPLIGAGPPPAVTGQTSVSEAFSAVMSAPPPSDAGIPSVTSFFQIDTRGRTLVYLIDCSGSMSKHNAFRHAKAELIASLERLDTNHKFQILFYSDNLLEFRDRNGNPDIHWATAANLSRARAYVSQMDNSGGTSHFPALMQALSYGPEVLFFLTDGAQPSLSARQMDELQRKNKGKTAIHCIEFGLGPDLGIENFLKEMARQNSGTYRYRDITKLAE